LPYLEFDNHRYYYAGDLNREGLPLIFCHGSGGRHHHWLYQLKFLKDEANPIAVDLPGHGRSGGTPANTVTSYREWLYRFYKAAGVGPLVLAGHSMGGAVALDFALNYPADVLGLILVGSGGRLRVLPAFLDELAKGSLCLNLFPNSCTAPPPLRNCCKKGRKKLRALLLQFIMPILAPAINLM